MKTKKVSVSTKEPVKEHTPNKKWQTMEGMEHSDGGYYWKDVTSYPFGERVCTLIIGTKSSKELTRIGEIIADAGTTMSECNMLPSQLRDLASKRGDLLVEEMKMNKEMLDALKENVMLMKRLKQYMRIHNLTNELISPDTFSQLEKSEAIIKNATK